MASYPTGTDSGVLALLQVPSKVQMTSVLGAGVPAVAFRLCLRVGCGSPCLLPAGCVSQLDPVALRQAVESGDPPSPGQGGHPGHCVPCLQVEQQRERYLEAYDAVLESDEMLDVVNGLLQHILCPGGHEDTPEQVYHGAQAHLPPLPLPPCLLPKTHVGRLVEAFVKKPHFSPIEGHTAVS